MVTRTQGKMVMTIGLVVFAIATWFAFQTPAPPSLSMAMHTSAASSSAAATDTPTVAAIATINSPEISALPKTSPAAHKPITITAPTSSAVWTIGEQHVIRWSNPGGAVGRLYLVSVGSGTIAGWIQQNIAPSQTYFTWNTRNVFISKTSPLGKDILPGIYVLKLSFDSPNVPGVQSVPFSIVAATTTE